MYQIFINGELAYDSTLSDYKIGRGEITKELDKSGSFVFSLYPDHPYYDRCILLRTEVVVYKSGRIVFRGRIIDEVTDYWNNKVLTCEGELGYLQDSIIRPYSIKGTPAEVFAALVGLHNEQVDEFQRFNVGICTVEDENNYIARENGEYETTLSNLNSRLLESATGGHFYITHGTDGTELTPTIHYLADFPKTSSQPIEFGQNLRDFTRTVKAEDVATAIIPLGATTNEKKLTISSVNDGLDFVYSQKGVAMYGWIFKVVEWDDVTVASNLKTKAQAYVDRAIEEALTIELTAVDMHLLDRNIESYEVCEYIPVISPPHGIDRVLLCSKQTMDMLNPANDSVVLGVTLTRFTDLNARFTAALSRVQGLSGQLNLALTAAQTTSEKLDALYAAGYAAVAVTVTDVNGEAAELLTTYGSLTVAGQRVTAEKAQLAIPAGAEMVVTYAPITDLGTPRIVTANGTALGLVSDSGESVSAILADVTDGSSIVVEFTVENTQ